MPFSKNRTKKIYYITRFSKRKDTASRLRMEGISAGLDTDVVVKRIFLDDRVSICREFASYSNNVILRFVSNFKLLFKIFVYIRLMKQINADLYTNKLILIYNPLLLDSICGFFISCFTRAKLLVDLTEIYHFSQFKFKFFDPRYMNFRIHLNFISLIYSGSIVISQRIADRLKMKSTLLVPPLMKAFTTNEIEGMPFLETNMNYGKIHTFVFSGSIGSKDAFNNIILAFYEIWCSGRQCFKLNIIGLSEQQFHYTLRNCIDDDEFIRLISCYGKVSNNVARYIIYNSDFSICVRPPSKHVDFGFPSKVSESVALTTPVIVNAFSDIPKYFKDRHNALIANGHDPLSIKIKVLEAMDLSHVEYNGIRSKCIRTYHEKFNPTSYRKSMSLFFDSLFISKKKTNA